MNSDFKETQLSERMIEHLMRSTRVNDDLSATVNRGLAAVFLGDVTTGVAIMREGGVPVHVVQRILTNKARRKSDWHH